MYLQVDQKKNRTMGTRRKINELTEENYKIKKNRYGEGKLTEITF